MSVDSPYPQLKKTHTMARVGRPWRDVKPPPSGPVWALINGVGTYWSLVAAVELGVFDGIFALGPTRIAPLAERLQVSAVHLGVLCDLMVAVGLLDQVDDVYELTETAERYLCTDGPASMAALVRVAPGPLANWERLPEVVRTGVVPQPVDDDAEGFYGPLVTATFPTQLRAATRLGLQVGWAKRPGLRVLDLGAGLAPWTVALLELSTGSTAVVNDLPGVSDLAATLLTTRGLGDRVEFRPGDYLTIPVEDEAFDIVVLGHVLRAEDEARGRALVARALTALRPGGQVVVADYFADDERKRHPFGVQMGLTMLANTARGGMRTHGQVAGWLSTAGFERVRLLEPIGFNHVFVASRPPHPRPESRQEPQP